MWEYSHLPVGHLPKLGCAHKLEGLVHAQLAVLLIRDDLCAQPSRGCCVHARADPEHAQRKHASTRPPSHGWVVGRREAVSEARMGGAVSVWITRVQGRH